MRMFVASLLVCSSCLVVKNCPFISNFPRDILMSISPRTVSRKLARYGRRDPGAHVYEQQQECNKGHRILTSQYS
jgi:hypothetical protein